MKTNLWKRTLSLLLATVMLIGATPLWVFADSDDNGKPIDLTDGVVLAIYNGDGYPGEPAVYGTDKYTRRHQIVLGRKLLNR